MAFESILEDSTSIREAAKEFDVPQSTQSSVPKLADYVKRANFCGSAFVLKLSMATKQVHNT